MMMMMMMMMIVLNKMALFDVCDIGLSMQTILYVST